MWWTADPLPLVDASIAVLSALHQRGHRCVLPGEARGEEPSTILTRFQRQMGARMSDEAEPERDRLVMLQGSTPMQGPLLPQAPQGLRASSS